MPLVACIADAGSTTYGGAPTARHIEKYTSCFAYSARAAFRYCSTVAPMRCRVKARLYAHGPLTTLGLHGAFRLRALQ